MVNKPKEEPDHSEQSEDDSDRSDNELEQMETEHNGTNKQRLGAEAMDPDDRPQHEDNTDILKDILKDDESDYGNSVGSIAAALLESDSLDSQSDSQAESQAEETTQPEGRQRRCKQWTPGTYATMHKGRLTSKPAIGKKKTERKTLKPKACYSNTWQKRTDIWNLNWKKNDWNSFTRWHKWWKPEQNKRARIRGQHTDEADPGKRRANNNKKQQDKTTMKIKKELQGANDLQEQ